MSGVLSCDRAATGTSADEAFGGAHDGPEEGTERNALSRSISPSHCIAVSSPLFMTTTFRLRSVIKTSHALASIVCIYHTRYLLVETSGTSLRPLPERSLMFIMSDSHGSILAPLEAYDEDHKPQYVRLGSSEHCIETSG